MINTDMPMPPTITNGKYVLKSIKRLKSPPINPTLITNAIPDKITSPKLIKPIINGIEKRTVFFVFNLVPIDDYFLIIKTFVKIT
ncbi:MAG: hypothetical protein DRP02_04455 [Candidatus Gerdarchaeota archaeon]|nr:MAG: hypothetical protein DRO63_02730 [Candidatus Gerdarchaeota archaeon]RLI71532.1 MAG: hypothetical protein DRP02_04455 [Candidatus Gerdarchaeota archaeon]